MRKFLLTSLLLVMVSISWGQELPFGKITISPYIPEDTELDATATRLLKTKLSQIVTTNEAVGGFDRRFIIVPFVNVLSEAETGTIPQMTSMKVSITFFVGDGVAGVLFNSSSIEVTGVGDGHADALYSAIRKVNAKNDGLQTLITEAKGRIVEYYNTTAPALIKEAEGFMASYEYEEALARLSVIPSLCSSYGKAQSLISKCGSKIIERDNNSLLIKAKAAWNANPDKDGATEASSYLSQIIISSSYYKNEVDKLTNQMRQRLAQLEDKRIELAKVKILSEERLEAERINASARVTSTFISSLPCLVFNILKWF